MTSDVAPRTLTIQDTPRIDGWATDGRSAASGVELSAQLGQLALHPANGGRYLLFPFDAAELFGTEPAFRHGGSASHQSFIGILLDMKVSCA